MSERRGFTIPALIVTLIINGVLLAVLYFLAGEAIDAANQSIPFFAVGAVITVVLGLALAWLGRRAAEPRLPAPSDTPGVRTIAPAPQPVRPIEPPVRPEAGAVQILSLLQRQGRLIDFLQEDLSMYDDAQIGAAVRNVHEGCKQVLTQHVRLEPIFAEAEGSTITLQPNFDTRAVRLTGEVVGEPPFTGALRHRGWRVASIDLPKQAGQEKELIVAAAEVEVNA